MSEHANYASITPGTPVFDALGAALGPVQAINANSLRVQSQDIPMEQIARVDATGVHLHLARAANTGSRSTETLQGGDQLVIPLAEERLTPSAG